jgi:transcriptional regulator with XRE-family HTH domain
MDTKKLIAKAKQTAGIKSNYALAKRLGVTQGTLSRYKLGQGHPAPYIAEKLAELAGMKPEAGVAICEHDRAKTPEQRKHWEMRICVDCTFETATCTIRQCSAKAYKHHQAEHNRRQGDAQIILMTKTAPRRPQKARNP